MNFRRFSTFTASLAAAALFAALAWPASGQDGPPASPSPDEVLPDRTVVIDVDSPERALYRIAVPNLLGGG